MRLNDEHVSAEEIDGELIAINFTTGKYFAMQDSATEIWNALLAGHDVDAIVAAQEGRSGFVNGEAAPQIRAFVDRLVAEELLQPGKTVAVAPLLPGTGPWQMPELEEFEDMAAILKLDPVVDLEQAGWPQAGG